MEEKNMRVSGTENLEARPNEYAVRIEKVHAMRKAGIEPWPGFKPVSFSCAQAIADFASKKDEATQYTLAGRVMSLRGHGKTLFAHIQDGSGRLQLYFKQDELGDQLFDQLKAFVDVGDMVWVQGNLFTTKTGETTLRVHDYTMLAKSLHPLPDKFHGLTDIEAIYRQRYLDLIMNPESKARFEKRFVLVKAMRRFFDEHGFYEVETPMLHPIPGGAAAKPFVTHHNALDIDLYLRIAPELYLKRLVIGGFERVYEINRCFRNEGISTRHNPEFTTVEFYVANHDYHFMMDFIEKLFRYVARQVDNSLQLPFGDVVIDLAKPFERIRMIDAVKKYGHFTDDDLSYAHMDDTLCKANIKIDPNVPWGNKLVALFEEFAEKQLVQPTFVTDYPIEISPLTKRDPNDALFVPRFELFISGMEFGNGFNELNDPFDQAARFKEQAAERARGDQEAHYYDADYVLALEHGLPPTVGAGIGIDRLAMLLTNTRSIKDVILFPTLRPKITDVVD